MERAVQLTYQGRLYTFRVDPDLPLNFWRVETEGRPHYRSPLRVTGDEQPGFFEALARAAEEDWGR